MNGRAERTQNVAPGLTVTELMINRHMALECRDRALMQKTSRHQHLVPSQYDIAIARGRFQQP